MSETDVLCGTSSTWYHNQLFNAYYWHRHSKFLARRAILSKLALFSPLSRQSKNSVVRVQVQDASEFADEVVKGQPPLPAFIGGQSLGGLISASVALRNQSVWTGMVLCSAAIDVEWNLTLR